MKARVKRTGQIVEVMTAFDHRDGAPAIVYEVLGHPEIKYRPEELEFYVTFDYIDEGVKVRITKVEATTVMVEPVE